VHQAQTGFALDGVRVQVDGPCRAREPLGDVALVAALPRRRRRHSSEMAPGLAPDDTVPRARGLVGNVMNRVPWTGSNRSDPPSASGPIFSSPVGERFQIVADACGKDFVDPRLRTDRAVLRSAFGHGSSICPQQVARPAATAHRARTRRKANPVHQRRKAFFARRGSSSFALARDRRPAGFPS